MKSIYSEAKQQLGNCMLHDNDDGASESPNLGQSNNSAFTTTGIGTYDDTLQRPFKYDRQRGRWSAGCDFYFASTGYAFGTVLFSEMSVYAFLYGGVFFLPAYLIAMLFYAIPIYVIQTFLGQFSSSGTISAFRVVPLFKGIGYSILILNLASLTYYGVITAVPLIYAANALHTVIPWMSCDNAWNTANCSTHTNYEEEEDDLYPHSSVEFFRYIIRSSDSTQSDLAISWPILCGVVAIWLVTLAMSLHRVSFIGNFFRCTCVLMLTVFFAIFTQILFESNISWATLRSYFSPIIEGSLATIMHSWRTGIWMATLMLGPGWGNILSLASHNSFRRDIERYTYAVCVTHVLLALASTICGRIALDHFEDHVGMLHYHVEEEHYLQFLYICYAYLFASFTNLPNFWSFLFFSMLFIAEVSALIIQMMSILTAIFDEYDKLRTKKTEITIGLTLIMMIASIYFCTKQGFKHLDILSNITILTHIMISMVLLLVATWFYGRERFQCDLQIMLGKTISNFKIFLIRFATPAFLLICALQVLFRLELQLNSVMLLLSQSVVYIVTPAYMVYKLCHSSGSWRHRLQQSLKPHDWHPVDAENRRFYDEVMGTSEMLVIDEDAVEHYLSDASSRASIS